VKDKPEGRNSTGRANHYLCSRVQEGIHATRREFGLDVTGEESAGLVIVFQHRIKVSDRESSDEQVRLFARAEFVYRTHFPLQVI